MDGSSPPDDLRPICANCAFWEHDGVQDSTSGQCRRYAPRQSMNPLNYLSLNAIHAVTDKLGMKRDEIDAAAWGVEGGAVWPTTYGGDWCGEHEPTPLQAAPPR